MKNPPWNNSKEFYDIQSKDLLSNLNEVPLYQAAVIGDTAIDFVNYIIDEADITANSNVVDFGCGTGFVVNQLSNICTAEGISDSESCVSQAKNNYPLNNFSLNNMESYSKRGKTHCLTLESLFYSNVEKTFKNTYEVLNKDGIFFIKEWFANDNQNKEKRQSLDFMHNILMYYPQRVNKILEIAKNNGFKLLRRRKISSAILNRSFWEKSLKLHHPYMSKYIADYQNEESNLTTKSNSRWMVRGFKETLTGMEINTLKFKKC